MEVLKLSTYVTSDIHGCYDLYLKMLDLIKFSNLANSYNKKIKNYKDIKDLIKDVYKNV